MVIMEKLVLGIKNQHNLLFFSNQAITCIIQNTRTSRRRKTTTIVVNEEALFLFSILGH
jgi:hypothetical protein